MKDEGLHDKLHDNVIDLCAKVAHEANRAYCRTIGDESQVAWDDAPDWQRESVIAGARKAVLDQTLTPEQSHQAWLDRKVSEGWSHGPVKDPERKTHPCCLPYAELPPEQRAKDEIFLATVRATYAALDTYSRETLAAVLAAAAEELRVATFT